MLKSSTLQQETRKGVEKETLNSTMSIVELNKYTAHTCAFHYLL